MSSSRTQLPRLPDRRRPTRGEERRAALLATLERLLEKRPLEDIGVGELTQAAGLGRSAFYFYFQSKEAAVAALLWEVFEEMISGAAAFLESDMPKTGVRASITTTVQLWHKHRPLVLAMLDACGSDPDVRALWGEWIDAFVERVAPVIEAERAAGRAPEGPDARALAEVLIGMNERALERNLRADADDERTAAMVDALVVTWLNAIYGRQP